LCGWQKGATLRYRGVDEVVGSVFAFVLQYLAGSSELQCLISAHRCVTPKPSHPSMALSPLPKPLSLSVLDHPPHLTQGSLGWVSEERNKILP
jgi:hypothetical protein